MGWSHTTGDSISRIDEKTALYIKRHLSRAYGHVYMMHAFLLTSASQNVIKEVDIRARDDNFYILILTAARLFMTYGSRTHEFCRALMYMLTRVSKLRDA